MTELVVGVIGAGAALLGAWIGAYVSGKEQRKTEFLRDKRREIIKLYQLYFMAYGQAQALFSVMFQDNGLDDFRNNLYDSEDIEFDFEKLYSREDLKEYAHMIYELENQINYCYQVQYISAHLNNKLNKAVWIMGEIGVKATKKKNGRSFTLNSSELKEELDDLESLKGSLVEEICYLNQETYSGVIKPGKHVRKRVQAKSEYFPE